MLEAAPAQTADVATALERLGYEDVRVTPDLTLQSRVVEGRRR